MSTAKWQNIAGSKKFFSKSSVKLRKNQVEITQNYRKIYRRLGETKANYLNLRKKTFGKEIFNEGKKGNTFLAKTNKE